LKPILNEERRKKEEAVAKAIEEQRLKEDERREKEEERRQKEEAEKKAEEERRQKEEERRQKEEERRQKESMQEKFKIMIVKRHEKGMTKEEIAIDVEMDIADVERILKEAKLI